ncbi:MAG: hypothetical protein RIQ89_1107 [Bacteroidota bacterium]|jgi:cob(I)alamin adenosyltransferase
MTLKIYTKKGDTGTTQLIGGTRIPKHHLRIESYGTIDELNAYLGLVRDSLNMQSHRETIKEIQDRLFTIGSLLASDPDHNKMKVPDLKESDISFLESEIDKMNEYLPEMKFFVLPGGLAANSITHIARCVCRRAERMTTQLAVESPVNPLVLVYLNRLSDYLFVLSRAVSHQAGVAEIPWHPRMQ